MPLTRNRLILVGIESTYGTAATLTGSNAIYVKNDLQINPLQMELVDRDLLYGYLGNSPRLASQQVGQISFSFELSGSGTAGTAPATGLFFRASGHSQTLVASTSVTYAPIGTGYEGITIDGYADGKRHRLTGVRGNLMIEWNAGEIPLGKFEGLGIYNAVTDTANPTPTYTAQATPAIVNSANTTTVQAFGYAACMQSFSFNAGRSPQHRQLAGCSRQIRIDQERKPEGELMVESVSIASKDYFTQATSQTLGQVSFVHNATAGNICTFTAPTCSLGDVEYDDSDGIEMLKLPYMPIPTSGNGYNDYTIVFT